MFYMRSGSKVLMSLSWLNMLAHIYIICCVCHFQACRYLATGEGYKLRGSDIASSGGVKASSLQMLIRMPPWY